MCRHAANLFCSEPGEEPRITNYSHPGAQQQTHTCHRGFRWAAVGCRHKDPLGKLPMGSTWSPWGAGDRCKNLRIRSSAGAEFSPSQTCSKICVIVFWFCVVFTLNFRAGFIQNPIPYAFIIPHVLCQILNTNTQAKS